VILGDKRFWHCQKRFFFNIGFVKIIKAPDIQMGYQTLFYSLELQVIQ